MEIKPSMMRGMVRGNTIVLDGESGFSEGQEVAVIVQRVLSPEDAIRQSFGGWAEDAEELDSFLQGVRCSRQQERPGLDS